MVGFIFGGNTGTDYESLQRKRKIADQMREQSISGTPRNVGEGLTAIGQALAGVVMDKRLKGKEAAARQEGISALESAYGGLGGYSGTPDMSGVEPIQTANPTGLPDSIIAAVDNVDPQYALPDSLIQTESGGNLVAKNNAVGSSGRVGHFGRGQFGQDRLDDAKRAGVIPASMTPDQFMQSEQAQKAVESWHVGDITNYIQENGLDKYVGQNIGGVVVTPKGMIAAAHLGGKAGLKKYIETGGQYNPADANGTSLSDYMATHGGQTGSAPNPQATIQALSKAISNPYLPPEQKAIAQALLGQAMQQMDPMYQAKLTAAQADAQGGGAGTEYGLTPQYITDADGNLKMIQLSKDGTAKEVALPEGAAIQKGVEKLDLGTHFQWHNTITGEPIGEPIPKNNRQAAADTAAGGIEGKTQAEAAINLPTITAKSESALRLIDEIIEDPALASITGMVQGRLPPLTQGGTDLNVKIKQLKGKVFMEAYESLKGGGVITEIEGEKAEAAIARLERAQSDEEYISALTDLKDVISGGLAVAAQKAGRDVPKPQAQPADDGWTTLPNGIRVREKK